MDCDCTETFQLIQALHSRTKAVDEYRRLMFDRGLPETWPTGTLYRIVRTLAWIQAAEWGQDKQEVVILKNMLLHQIRSRAALRDMHQKLREIWVNP